MTVNNQRLEQQVVHQTVGSDAYDTYDGSFSSAMTNAALVDTYSGIEHSYTPTMTVQGTSMTPQPPWSSPERQLESIQQQLQEMQASSRESFLDLKRFRFSILRPYHICGLSAGDLAITPKRSLCLVPFFVWCRFRVCFAIAVLRGRHVVNAALMSHHRLSSSSY